MSDAATVYLAEVDSRNFTFRVIGATRNEAIAALVHGLNQHTVQYGCTPDWWRDLKDDFRITAMTIGRAQRDGEDLPV